MDVVQLLIEAGADVNLTDAQGWSALTWASSNGYTDISRYLKMEGADTKLVSSSGKSLEQMTKKNTAIEYLKDGEDDQPKIALGQRRKSAYLSLSDTEVNLDGGSFNWEVCSMDQLFVFEAASIDHITNGKRIVILLLIV